MTITDTHPLIATEWHPTKNGDQKITNYTYGSNKKVWWLGACGHEWDMKVSKRTLNNQGCPYCVGKRILQGYNDLATIHPLIATEWHPKNLLKATQISAGSGKRMWWKCEKNHEWEMRINSRTGENQGCPYCSGRRAIKGETDLRTLNPSVASEWHPTKNGKLTPAEVTLNSHRKIWWQCEKGHEWETEISKRTFAGHNCPICVNQHNHPVYKGRYAGIKSLNLTHPLIATQWHPTKNRKLNPENFTSGSDTKVWWVGSCGHEWEGNIYRRTTENPRGCSVCQSSSGELAIVNYVRNLFSEDQEVIRNSRKIIPPFELDIYIPEKMVAIEYNGLYWHSERTKPKSYHYDKWLACKEVGIQLIQIWEDDWKRNPELVKRMLAYELNTHNKGKTFQTKTIVRGITPNEANIFFKENHIQTYINSNHVYLGLVNNSYLNQNNSNKLIEVISIEPKMPIVKIIHYSTSYQTPSGFTKLLKAIEERYSDFEKIIATSDNATFNDKPYRKNGFSVIKGIPPSYIYVSKDKRKHKIELSEDELIGLYRIWDAGKTVWEKNLR